MLLCNNIVLLRLICSVEESCEKALRDPSILEDFDLVIVISSESALVKIILGWEDLREKLGKESDLETSRWSLKDFLKYNLRYRDAVSWRRLELGLGNTGSDGDLEAR